MKKQINMVAFCIAVCALSGCAALKPPTLPSSSEPSEGTSIEENIPSVQEVELSEAGTKSESSASSGTQMEEPMEERLSETSEAEETDTEDAETAAPATEQETLTGYFLTEQDENYLYEVAYRTGDYSALDGNQTQVLDAALQIVAQCEGLSDYEKALFVHDDLTASITYGFSDEPYNAYGALVERMAVCQGYAYAYKLCMDLLEIPCITVGGTADNGDQVMSHAWNMILLEDQWYHVDTTWDDATTSEDYGSWCHLYFCVDDAFMAQNHTWTDLVQDFHGMGEIPAAADRSQFYFQRVKELIYSQEQFEQVFDADYQMGLRGGEYCCYGFEPDTSFIGDYAAGSLISQELGDYVLMFIKLQ